NKFLQDLGFNFEVRNWCHVKAIVLSALRLTGLNAKLARLLLDQSARFEHAAAEIPEHAVAAFEFYNGVASVLEKVGVSADALSEMVARVEEQMNRVRPFITQFPSSTEVESAFTPGKLIMFKHDMKDLEDFNLSIPRRSIGE
ncbi:MAG: hypothetical protein Q9184_007601, partial [Pyrenodesmia sp. 2 TL-2023]